MILITGANGQLGQELKNILDDNATYVDVDELDITNKDAVKDFCEGKGFRYIINCAAYTAVDKAEHDENTAYEVNVTGPKNLAKTRIPLIHISTDYVFDGKNYKPYTEDDQTNPQSVYGKTKLQGEKAVMDEADTAIIIRTSWLYSVFGNNFVRTMQRLGREKDELNVIFDQIGTPTNAKDLAQAIVDILPKVEKGTKEIYHFSNEGVCSWYDFAKEIMALSNITCNVMPIETKDYPTPASRPFYSVLNKAKLKKDFGIKIKHWKETLAESIEGFK